MTLEFMGLVERKRAPRGAVDGQIARREARQPQRGGGAQAGWQGRRGAQGETVARNADQFAEGLAPVIEDIRASGATSLRAMADELNRRGIVTRRGGRWHVSNVRNLIRRTMRG